MRTTTSLALLTTIVAALVAAACGRGESTTRPAHHRPAAKVEHPRGADDVVVQVSSGGGFVPVGYDLGSLPGYTLYGDGTLIEPGSGGGQGGTHAYVAPVRRQLSEAQVQQVLARAKRAGLLAAKQPDFGSPSITDSPSTSVTIVTGTTTHHLGAYALGMGDGAGGLTARQRAARTTLSGWIDALPEGRDRGAYRPTELAVFATPEADDAATGHTHTAWPSSVPLAGDASTRTGAPSPEGTDCLRVHGDDVGTVLGALEAAGPNDDWTSGGGTYAVIVRPALPGETACANFASHRTSVADAAGPSR